VTRATGDQDFARDWGALRGDGDIQFARVAIPEKAPPPDWLVRLQQWLAETLEPFSAWLTDAWPVLKWVLLALLIALVLFALIRLIGPDLLRRRKRPKAEEQWTPERAAALALLEEADRLAAEGRFDEATHLLLQRSVGQIAEARPDLVEPASTARELAVLSALPEAARRAFSVIASRVERSLFALSTLNESDWQAARSAYADFALDYRAISQAGAA